MLGDQLNIQHSWFHTVQHQAVYVLMELRSETDYARHHIQKIASIFRGHAGVCRIVNATSGTR